MSLVQKISQVLKLVFPSDRSQWVLFVVFLILYGALATVIALDYRIIFDNRIPWDAYFSFDNRAIVMTGGGFERHPLANYFFSWIREFALWVSQGKMNGTFRLVLAWFSVIAISLNLVQIYKYLRVIIELPLHLSWLIVVFFAWFSTNLLLSFTPETYTYSLLFLTLFNYYAALKLKSDGRFSIAALSLATVAIGGLTVTNATKVFFAFFYEKGLFKSVKSIGNGLFRAGAAVGVFVLLFLYRMNFDYAMIISKTADQYEKFSKPKTTPIWDMVASWFFGGNVLFSSFITRDYHNKKGFEYQALFQDVYSSWVPYLFVALLLGLIVWSVIKNWRNKLVQILVLIFSFDILVHVVLKFGLHTSYIYGGHFVLVYPLLLGWLFYAYRTERRFLNLITGILGFMTLYLVLNNGYRLLEFFEFLNRFYV